MIRQCEAVAVTYAAENKSRDEELAALAKAKEIIVEATGGTAAAFIQFASSRDLHSYEVVRPVRDLERTQHSNSLAQLASKTTADREFYACLMPSEVAFVRGS